MNKFSFENQGSNTFLVYAVGPEESLDSLSLGMLTHNKIPGLAATLFTQMDKERFIRYNVSAKVSVRQFFNGPVNKKRLLGVLSGVVDAMLSAEDYMLDPNSLILDQDYIFADVSTCETVMVCLPVEEPKQNTDIAMFFKTILFSTQFDQSENCDHVARLINYLNSSPAFSLADFKATLEKIKAGGGVSAPQAAPKPSKPPERPSSVGKATDLRKVQPPVQQPVQPPVKPQPPVQKPPVQPPVQKPPVQPPVVPPVVPQRPDPVPQTPEDDGKKISLMYVLQHYNKENAALYKAQKEAGKEKKKNEKAKPDKKDKGDKKGKKDESKQPAPQPAGRTPFAVPGQSASPAPFAVPGQPAPQPAAAPATPAPEPARPQPANIRQAPVQPAQTDLPPMPTGGGAVSGGKRNYGDTTILSGGGAASGETVVLSAMNTPAPMRPYLIRKKNNERILVDKPVFRIGKERSYVDYFIGDNSAISRSHANIIERDGAYFVMDTNSTNHTYVDGSMIQSNVEAPIASGTIIRLANEDFEFKLM